MDITIELNMRLQPVHLYELNDVLDEKFEDTAKGEVTGDGFVQDPNGEIKYCHIDVELYKGSPENIEWLKKVLTAIGIAKNSKLLYDDKEEPIGTLEGAAYYLNSFPLFEKCRVVKIA